MQIIIDIPKEKYDLCKKWKPSERSELQEAVVSGIPLPKGHSDLVELGKVIDIVTEYVPDDDGSVGNTNLKDLLYEVENMEQVIEADREA